MAMEVNGAAILRAISEAPGSFAMTEAHVNDAALVLLLSRLKDKATKLDGAKMIASTVGKHDFSLALDHLTAKELGTINKRFDAKNVEVGTTDVSWHRDHLSRLVDGSLDPVLPPPRQPTPPRRPPAPKAPKAPKPPKTGEVMKSKALKSRAPRKAPTKGA